VEKNMNFSRASWMLGLAAIAAIASQFAAADDSGWYLGANVGQSRATIDDARITSGLLGQGFFTTSIDDRNRDTGFKLFGGYQLNRNFGLEGGYFDTGKFGFNANTVPTGTLDGNIRITGLNLDLVGTVPLGEKFSAFGRAGLIYAESKDTFAGTGAIDVLSPNPNKSAANYKFGLGLQYALNPSLGLRLEAERYRIDDAVGNKGDIDLFSIGLVYRFGAKTPTPALRAPPPEPVPAKPAPVVAAAIPPPPPPPAPPAPVKVSFAADTLFEFDKATIKPEGKAAIDAFAKDLRGVKFSVINVTGHTDRIGSESYNMKLSALRAEAVRSYLVESAEIPAAKIVASGKDGADPVTKPGECKGKTKTRKLIACLQPDRRVDIEVTGTR
jgi:OOP family OmpA-OmpF porin